MSVDQETMTSVEIMSDAENAMASHQQSNTLLSPFTSSEMSAEPSNASNPSSDSDLFHSAVNACSLKFSIENILTPGFGSNVNIEPACSGILFKSLRALDTAKQAAELRQQALPYSTIVPGRK